MVKKVTNRISLLFGTSLILLLCIVALYPIKAKAEIIPVFPDTKYSKCYYYYEQTVDNRPMYGKPYANTLDADCHDEYIWNLDEQKINWHIFVRIESVKPIDELSFCKADLNGYNAFCLKDGFSCKYDKKIDKYVYTYVVTTKKDDICVCSLYNYSNTPQDYSICITREREIVLAKTAISEITNTKQRTMTVKYAPVKKRLGYQIEYSTDNKFKDKQRVNTGAATKDIGKLTRGKTYYVRVRTYARYNDGTLVYSKWSGTRKIKITK